MQRRFQGHAADKAIHVLPPCGAHQSRSLDVIGIKAAKDAVKDLTQHALPFIHSTATPW